MGQIRSRRQKYESTKSKHGMQAEQGCLIDMLSDDALLKIFSYISLYDKGRVARTCKRWKTLTKQAQLWQTIDFWEPLDIIAPCTDKWTYPFWDRRCAYRTLKILKTYSYASLRRVYLRVANLKIMRYLANNSPHLLTLSLLSSTQSESSCDRDIRDFFHKDNFVLPHSLEQLQLSFMPGYCNNGVGDYKPIYCIDNLLQDLSQRKRLRELRVRNTIFSPDAFLLMTSSVDGLEELELENCKSVTDEIMQIIAKNLPSLKVLELRNSSPYTDEGLRAIKDHLFHGRTLLSDYEYRGDRRSLVIDDSDCQPIEVYQEQEEECPHLYLGDVCVYCEGPMGPRMGPLIYLHVLSSGEIKKNVCFRCP